MSVLRRFCFFSGAVEVEGNEAADSARSRGILRQKTGANSILFPPNCIRSGDFPGEAFCRSRAYWRPLLISWFILDNCIKTIARMKNGETHASSLLLPVNNHTGSSGTCYSAARLAMTMPPPPSSTKLARPLLSPQLPPLPPRLHHHRLEGRLLFPHHPPPHALEVRHMSSSS